MHVGILRHFPDTVVAEHEVVARCVGALDALGWHSTIIDVSPTMSWKSYLEQEASIDVVFDMHFQYPKFSSVPSLGVLWTPLEFMRLWGLGTAWGNQLSHDQLAATGDSRLEELSSLFTGELSPLPRVNHSLPAAHLELIDQVEPGPDLRCVYVGVNWDKRIGRPGRHDQFFRRLDNENVLDIYGPRRLGPVTPWEGYRSYRGELPFDGLGVPRVCRRAGVVLVLSSQEHLTDNISSNRLFEACAAGAVVISDNHKFVRDHLGDDAIYIDFSRGDDEAALHLVEVMKRLRSDPNEVIQRQRASRAAFNDGLGLEVQLEAALLQTAACSGQQVPHGTELWLSEEPTSEFLHGLQQTELAHTDLKIFTPVDLDNASSCLRASGSAQALLFSGRETLSQGIGRRLAGLVGRMERAQAIVGFLGGVVTHSGTSFAPTSVHHNPERGGPLNGMIVRRVDDNLSLSGCVVDHVTSWRVHHAKDLLPTPMARRSAADILSGVVTGTASGQTGIWERSLREEVDVFQAEYTNTGSSLLELAAQASPAERQSVLRLLVAGGPVVRHAVAIRRKWRSRR